MPTDSCGGLVHPLITRSHAHIANRACSNVLLLSRWSIEASHLTAPQPNSSRLTDAMSAVSASLAANKDKLSFETREKELLERDLGLWKREDIAELNSQWEAIGVLLSTLRIFKDIPSFTTLYDPESLFRSTAISNTPPSLNLSSPRNAKHHHNFSGVL